MLSSLLLIVSITKVICEVEDKNNEELSNIQEADKSENFYSNVLKLAQSNIDKDTIINSNFKLEKKNRGITSPSNQNTGTEWSYEPFPKDVAYHVASFKKNMTECLKEVEGSEKRVQSLSPNKESPINGECLIACVLKRNGVLDGGKVNQANLVILLNKFHLQQSYNPLALATCAAQAEMQRDECRAAAALSVCAGDLMHHGLGTK